MKRLNFYTDGACNQEKSGGWAFHCPELNLAVCGSKKETTNNEMELKAIGNVLKYLIQAKITKREIIIHSDSAWCIGAISQEWKLKCHVEYVKSLKGALNHLKIEHGLIIKFNKVKGHNNIAGNELCDSLAVIMSNKK